jgi:hypothetical protein
MKLSQKLLKNLQKSIKGKLRKSQKIPLVFSLLALFLLPIFMNENTFLVFVRRFRKEKRHFGALNCLFTSKAMMLLFNQILTRALMAYLSVYKNNILCYGKANR